jgi:hypothetical protein
LRSSHSFADKTKHPTKNNAEKKARLIGYDRPIVELRPTFVIIGLFNTFTLILINNSAAKSNCTQTAFDYPPLKRRMLQAESTGGDITSVGGVLLLRQIHRRLD